MFDPSNDPYNHLINKYFDIAIFYPRNGWDGDDGWWVSEPNTELFFIPYPEPGTSVKDFEKLLTVYKL